MSIGRRSAFSWYSERAALAVSQKQVAKLAEIRAAITVLAPSGNPVELVEGRWRCGLCKSKLDLVVHGNRGNLSTPQTVGGLRAAVQAEGHLARTAELLLTPFRDSFLVGPFFRV